MTLKNVKFKMYIIAEDKKYIIMLVLFPLTKQEKLKLTLKKLTDFLSL